VADQDERSGLLRQRQPGRGHVVGRRRGGVLHDGNVVSVFAQSAVDLQPAGTIDESAVHQHDVPDFAAAWDIHR
jgi:hypothetical protein